MIAYALGMTQTPTLLGMRAACETLTVVVKRAYDGCPSASGARLLRHTAF